MTILLVVLLVGVAMWGQYWFDRAKRLQDAIAFMVDEEVDND